VKSRVIYTCICRKVCLLRKAHLTYIIKVDRILNGLYIVASYGNPILNWEPGGLSGPYTVMAVLQSVLVLMASHQCRSQLFEQGRAAVSKARSSWGDSDWERTLIA
jgi:hypothetical protein